MAEERHRKYFHDFTLIYLNRSYGSVQDRWSDLNLESDLTTREMEY